MDIVGDVVLLVVFVYSGGVFGVFVGVVLAKACLRLLGVKEPLDLS